MYAFSRLPGPCGTLSMADSCLQAANRSSCCPFKLLSDLDGCPARHAGHRGHNQIIFKVVLLPLANASAFKEKYSPLTVACSCKL